MLCQAVPAIDNVMILGKWVAEEGASSRNGDFQRTILNSPQYVGSSLRFRDLEQKTWLALCRYCDARKEASRRLQLLVERL